MPYKKDPTPKKKKKLTQPERAAANSRFKAMLDRLHDGRIISVGYSFIPTDTMKEAIATYLDAKSIDPSGYDILNEVYFGTLYNTSCKGGIQRSNVATGQKEMEKWYEKNKTKQTSGYSKSIWIMQKPNVIAVKVVIASQIHYAFLAKTSDKMSTTYFKRVLNNGCVKPSIDETFAVALTPYCHKR